MRATSSLPVPFSPEMSTRPLVGRRHRHLLAQLVHGVALAHHRQVLVDARAQRPVLDLEALLAQRVGHDEHRLLERQRLLDEVERADLDRPHGRLDVAVPGDHHDGGVDLAVAQPLQRRQPVDAGQPDVEQDRRRRRRASAGRGRPRRCRRPRRRSPRRAARRSAPRARPVRRRRRERLPSHHLRHAARWSGASLHGSSIVNRVPRG